LSPLFFLNSTLSFRNQGLLRRPCASSVCSLVPSRVFPGVWFIITGLAPFDGFVWFRKLFWDPTSHHLTLHLKGSSPTTNPARLYHFFEDPEIFMLTSPFSFVMVSPLVPKENVNEGDVYKRIHWSSCFFVSPLPASHSHCETISFPFFGVP